MIDAVPLVTAYNKGKLLGWSKQKVPDPKWIQWALWTQYCMALRISEVISLHPNDFNFDRKILTLNRTKTGFKHCKCSKWKKRKLIKVDDNCDKCKGIGKYRVKQFTSIPPDYPKWCYEAIIVNQKDGRRLGQLNRQLLWSYVKKACKLAQLEIGEQQEERYIEGAWTHLIRKSRAKLMDELGAKEVLIKVKLRHTFSTTELYTKPDINTLIKWESENIEAHTL